MGSGKAILAPYWSMKMMALLQACSMMAKLDTPKKMAYTSATACSLPAQQFWLERDGKERKLPATSRSPTAGWFGGDCVYASGLQTPIQVRVVPGTYLGGGEGAALVAQASVVHQTL